jgi:hypothetical protein
MQDGSRSSLRPIGDETGQPIWSLRCEPWDSLEEKDTMDIGTLVLMFALAYGLGLAWYQALGQAPAGIWRVMAYPFVAIVLAEVFVPFGPVYGEVHVLGAAGAALVGVIIDRVIQSVRPTAAAPALESRTAATAS